MTNLIGFCSFGSEGGVLQCFGFNIQLHLYSSILPKCFSDLLTWLAWIQTFQVHLECFYICIVLIPTLKKPGVNRVGDIFWPDVVQMEKHPFVPGSCLFPQVFTLFSCPSWAMDHGSVLVPSSAAKIGMFFRIESNYKLKLWGTTP